MGNEITKQLMKFVRPIMHMLQDGMKSESNNSPWDMIVSLYEAGN